MGHVPVSFSSQLCCLLTLLGSLLQSMAWLQMVPMECSLFAQHVLRGLLLQELVQVAAVSPVGVGVP
jgi:hypothetical protein